jgi:Skp family chaperone for outer membrane proteins
LLFLKGRATDQRFFVSKLKVSTNSNFQEYFIKMKKCGLITAAFAFVVFLGATAFAQVPVATGKIGWIDSGAFADEKAGITKYVNAYKALATEAKPRETELVGIQTKIQTIAKELDDMSKAAATVPIKQDVAAAKQDEGARLQREFEFKKKEYDAFIQKRGGEILGPVNQDIGKAISDFGKQKGYTAIFDIDKLAQVGAILHLDAAANVTKEFIAFYNTRPAGAATAATPK